MARLILHSAVLLVVLGATTHTAHAQVDVPDDVAAVADQAGVDPLDLLGAITTTNLAPREYLCRVGELACPRTTTPSISAVARRADCIIRVESGGDPHAVNRITGASGLGQFLGSTWRTTPQGRAGYSVFDAGANRSAVEWMLSVGRSREFVAVSGGWC